LRKNIFESILRKKKLLEEEAHRFTHSSENRLKQDRTRQKSKTYEIRNGDKWRNLSLKTSKLEIGTLITTWWVSLSESSTETPRKAVNRQSFGGKPPNRQRKTEFQWGTLIGLG